MKQKDTFSLTIVNLFFPNCRWCTSLWWLSIYPSTIGMIMNLKVSCHMKQLVAIG